MTYFKEAVLLCSESSFAQRHGTPRFDFADLLQQVKLTLFPLLNFGGGLEERV